MSSHHLDEMDAPQPGEKNISALELSFLEHILFHVLYENTESERFARASWKHGHVRSENIPPALIISSPGWSLCCFYSWDLEVRNLAIETY